MAIIPTTVYKKGNAENDSSSDNSFDGKFIDVTKSVDRKKSDVKAVEMDLDDSFDMKFSNSFENIDTSFSNFDHELDSAVASKSILNQPVDEQQSGYELAKAVPPALPAVPAALSRKNSPLPSPASERFSKIPPLPQSKFSETAHNQITEAQKHVGSSMGYLESEKPADDATSKKSQKTPKLNTSTTSTFDASQKPFSSSATPRLVSGGSGDSNKFNDDMSHLNPNTSPRKMSHQSTNSVASTRRKPPPLQTNVHEPASSFATPTTVHDATFDSNDSTSTVAESVLKKGANLFNFNKSASSHHLPGFNDASSTSSKGFKLGRRKSSTNPELTPELPHQPTASSPKLTKTKGFLKKFGIKTNINNNGSGANSPNTSREHDSFESNDSGAPHGVFSTSGSTKRSNFFKPVNLSLLPKLNKSGSQLEQKEEEKPPVVTPVEVDDALYNYRLTVSQPKEEVDDDVRFSKIIDMDAVIEEEEGGPKDVIKNPIQSPLETNAEPETDFLKIDLDNSPKKKPSALGITTTGLNNDSAALEGNDSKDSFDFHQSSPVRTSFAAGLSSALEEKVFSTSYKKSKSRSPSTAPSSAPTRIPSAAATASPTVGIDPILHNADTYPLPNSRKFSDEIAKSKSKPVTDDVFQQKTRQVSPTESFGHSTNGSSSRNMAPKEPSHTQSKESSSRDITMAGTATPESKPNKSLIDGVVGIDEKSKSTPP
ncbi:unnamed protein product [Ambrosiozyma monospora]|uniref:Unnamed protein product n=1 Tax=Ambrosiozyma monospora TaxID=43982 RepID=A0ACB5T3T5_AMBMO|nr:unnamed protein product [Ambrosiozyma monospora]